MREKCVEPRNRYLTKNYYIVRNRNLCVRYFKKKFFSIFEKNFIALNSKFNFESN